MEGKSVDEREKEILFPISRDNSSFTEEREILSPSPKTFLFQNICSIGSLSMQNVAQKKVVAGIHLKSIDGSLTNPCSYFYHIDVASRTETH